MKHYKDSARTALAVTVLVGLAALTGGCDQNQERRDKVLACWNDYAEHVNTAATCWNRFVDAKTPAQKREQLRQCHLALDGMDPFKPLGVDAKLADAIAAVKNDWTQEVDFETQQLDAWVQNPFKRSELATARLASTTKAQSVLNLIASEVGQLETSKPPAVQ